MSDPDVRHAPDRNRFEIFLDGTLAGYVDYHREGEAFALTHTQVLPEFGGRGVGHSLIAGTLEQIRALGGGALPYCGFIPKVIRDNPDLLDVVPESARPKFGL